MNDSSKKRCRVRAVRFPSDDESCPSVAIVFENSAPLSKQAVLKSDHNKPNQTKSSQIKPNQAKSSHFNDGYHKTFPAKAPKWKKFPAVAFGRRPDVSGPSSIAAFTAAPVSLHP
jgi:hypothetical protein